MENFKWPFVKFDSHSLDEREYVSHHQDKFKLVAGIIETLKPASILDIGAAVGSVYSFIENSEAIDIEALEIVDDFITVLEKRGITPHKIDLDHDQSFPIADNSIDVAICDSILEHTLRPKWLLQEVRRVVRKGGHIILVVPNATSAKLRWNHFRGRNILYPLIDNLFTSDYLRRCSVFYSRSEIQKYVGGFFTIQQVIMLDERSHDQKNVTTLISRLLSKVFPQLRDVIIVVGCKGE